MDKQTSLPLSFSHCSLIRNILCPPLFRCTYVSIKPDPTVLSQARFSLAPVGVWCEQGLTDLHGYDGLCFSAIYKATLVKDKHLGSVFIKPTLVSEIIVCKIFSCPFAIVLLPHPGRQR